MERGGIKEEKQESKQEKVINGRWKEKRKTERRKDECKKEDRKEKG